MKIFLFGVLKIPTDILKNASMFYGVKCQLCLL